MHLTCISNNNNGPYQAYIVQLRNNRYAAIKPPKNKYTELDEIFKSFPHAKLKEYVLNLIN